MMFTSGSLSVIVASGWLPVVTLLTGNTTNVLGAKPKLHCSVAPLQTCCAMIAPPVTVTNMPLRQVSQLNSRVTGVARLNDASTAETSTDRHSLLTSLAVKILRVL
jgi:hypothetical protein